MRQWMALKFKLEGDENLSRALVNVGSRLNDYTEPLKKASELVLTDIRTNFDTEGSFVGGWKELASGTVKERKRLGFGPEHPILHRTGRYKRSFKAKLSRKKAVIDAWGVKYHKYHQSSKPRRYPPKGLPRRQTMFLRNEVKAEIVRAFQEYLRFNR